MAAFDTKRPRWGLIEFAFTYLSIIVVTILFSLFGDIFGLFYWVIGNEVAYFMLSFIVQFIATVVLVFFVAVTVKKASIADLGIRRAARKDYLKYGILGGAFLMLAIVVLGYPINYLQPDLQPQVFEEILRSVDSLLGFILLFTVGAVLAPLSEELLYRGMLYPVLRWYLGPTWGMILAGFIFGLAHLDLWRALPLAAGGAVLCYIYEKTGSILVSTVAHGVWNGVMSIFVYISVNNLIPI